MLVKGPGSLEIIYEGHDNPNVKANGNSFSIRVTNFNWKESKTTVLSNNGASCEWNGPSLGAVSIRKTVLPGMAIPMLKIRRPNGRLIFNMEIAIRR